MAHGARKHMRLIITGGGTGGHLFPGIAIAESVLKKFDAGKVLFIGTGRQIDARTLAGRGFETAAIVAHGLKGKSFLKRLQALVELPFSVVSAGLLIHRFRPDLVFGVGGYVTWPVVVAARIMGVPTCIHEQNSIPGLANRWLGKLTDRIFVSLPGSEKYFPAARTILTGNPVRPELLDQAGREKKREDKVTILVLGGSQGAHRVNELVVGAIAGLPVDKRQKIRLIHQTGASDEGWVKGQYEIHDVEAEVAAFFNDMGRIYGQADFLVSRAGATTLAEITSLEKAAILIPYPYAADDHQVENARYLVEGGAAVMFVERQLTEEKLGREMLDLVENQSRRRQMGEAAGKLAKTEALDSILNQCLALVENHMMKKAA